jgi:DNA-binding transcriptional LysR family regulator
VSLQEARDDLRELREMVAAYGDFFERVAGITIGLAEERHPATLLLLDAMKDFHARTGEFVTTEEGTG